MNEDQANLYLKAITEGYKIVRKTVRDSTDRERLEQAINNLKTLAAVLVKDEDKALVYGYLLLFTTRKNLAATTILNEDSRMAAIRFEPVFDALGSLFDQYIIDAAHYGNVALSYARVLKAMDENAKAIAVLKKIMANAFTSEKSKAAAITQLAELGVTEGIIKKSIKRLEPDKIELTNDDRLLVDHVFKVIELSLPPAEGGMSLEAYQDGSFAANASVLCAEGDPLIARASPDAVKAFNSLMTYSVEGPTKFLFAGKHHAFMRHMLLVERPHQEGFSGNLFARLFALRYLVILMDRIKYMLDLPGIEHPFVSFSSETESITLNYSQKKAAFLEIFNFCKDMHNQIASIFSLEPLIISLEAPSLAAAAAGAGLFPAAAAGAGSGGAAAPTAASAAASSASSGMAPASR